MTWHQPLRGQKALVTGASSGIGKGRWPARSAHAGADVVVNFVTMLPRRPSASPPRSRGGGVRAIAIHADVSREADVQAMFRRMLGEWGTIDILVNNAGLQRDAAVHRDDPGAVECRDRGEPHRHVPLLARGGTGNGPAGDSPRGLPRRRQDPLRLLGARIDPVGGPYQLCRLQGRCPRLRLQSLAQEMRPRESGWELHRAGRHPDPINRTAWETEAALKALLTLIPYGRIGQPEDIGRAAVWLASDDSDYVHGQTLFVDGGMTLYPEFARGG